MHITKHQYKQTTQQDNFLQNHSSSHLNSVQDTDTETDTICLLSGTFNFNLDTKNSTM